MDILAVESSTPRGSIALWRDGRLVDVRTFTSERAHNAVLFAPLKEVLALTEDLELIVTGTGPGSYTGVRVGIAAAIGVALARSVPLIGLPSLTALAHGDGVDRYAVCGDARRGTWWWAEVENGALTTGPECLSAADLAVRAAAWTGHLFTIDPASPPGCAASPTFPKAEILARAASGLSDNAIARLAARQPEPIYLSAPFVTISRQPVFV